jgi:hypothetical protein
MEFDLINEMLTATVAQLFTNKQAHSNFFKGSSEIRENKNELPSGPSFLSKSLSSASQKPQHILSWLETEGEKWLRGALKRLKVDEKVIMNKNYNLPGFSIEELLLEKRKVKNELKHFDSNFISLFSRQPERTDKECMRPLYMYYKKLKQGITKKNSLQNHYNSSSIESVPRLVDQSSGSSISGYSSSQSAQSDGGLFEESKELKIDQNKLIMNKLSQEIKNSNYEDTVSKVNQLKKERASLRTTLDRFQQEFMRAHQRKIKYNKDIAPVANEFKRYKELKKIIAKYEDNLKKLSNIH